jgi:hypothetical protein
MYEGGQRRFMGRSALCLTPWKLCPRKHWLIMSRLMFDSRGQAYSLRPRSHWRRLRPSPSLPELYLLNLQGPALHPAPSPSCPGEDCFFRLSPTCMCALVTMFCTPETFSPGSQIFPRTGQNLPHLSMTLVLTCHCHSRRASYAAIFFLLVSVANSFTIPELPWLGPRLPFQHVLQSEHTALHSNSFVEGNTDSASCLVDVL